MRTDSLTTLALCQTVRRAVLTTNTYSHIPASEMIPHQPSLMIASLPLILCLLTLFSLVVSALASLCYSKSKTLGLPVAYQWRIVQSCAWTTEAMQWVVLLCGLFHLPLAAMLFLPPRFPIHSDPATGHTAIVLAWTSIGFLHWRAIGMIDWMDSWMNSEEYSIVDGLQPFMLTRAAATKAWSIASPPKHELPMRQKPSFPSSSLQTTLNLQLHCNVDLKLSALPNIRAGRNSWCSTSPEHSTDAQSTTISALSSPSSRRYSEPIPSLTPLKKYFDVHHSRSSPAPEIVDAETADRALSLATATSETDGSDLSSAVRTKTSWVRTCVEQFEGLQPNRFSQANVKKTWKMRLAAGTASEIS